MLAARDCTVSGERSGLRSRYVDVQVQIDEELLKKISESTGGQYFRAVDRDSLERIFKTIDGLESRESASSLTRTTTKCLAIFFGRV